MNDCTGALHCLRVLRDEPAPAAWNMAVDDALLQLADEPTLRLYGWWPHAVSLGWLTWIFLMPDTRWKTR